MNEAIEAYTRRIVGTSESLVPTEIFAKILTTNDDAGRHGVLIPTESYSFFPELPIPDPTVNATALFSGVDVITSEEKALAWKYYERYPERRVTRLNAALNDESQGRRLVIFLRCRTGEKLDRYYVDVSREDCDARFDELLGMLFGAAVPSGLGAFVRLPIDAPPFQPDEPLCDLLERFDGVKDRWIDSLRGGSTGIGYTFETLVGVKENNDQGADFRGIELKCKLARDKQLSSGKINLFQLGPVWSTPQPGIDRLRAIGQKNAGGNYSCHSQVTTTVNNLGLSLGVQPSPEGINLYHHSHTLGAWARARLAERLTEKHSRAVFVKAESREGGPCGLQYKYSQLVYCERPDIQRFIDMVDARRIVFEFIMIERPPGRVRNHGYPWRLVDERQLDQLFALQLKLRG